MQSSSSNISSECLLAFDAARGSILEAAKKAYARGYQSMYMLNARDFK